MIQIVRTSRNLTMRFMERIHGVAIASLHELIHKKGLQIDALEAKRIPSFEHVSLAILKYVIRGI